MKKVVLFGIICLTALTIHAQRCAVLEFKARVGISQADVDGISAIFITYFQPAGYTMVERTQIDKAIDEQGFQRSSMTEQQMVRIGKILNVSKIVIGDVNVVMGQYNVDVRVINVETGTIAATEGATFASTSYRTSMQNVAQKLAAKIAIKPSATVPTAPETTAKKRTSVEVLYGYLKIFPHELGVFESEPMSVISQINAQAQYGYNNWRIPTDEELSLLRANKYLGNGNYMTRESKRGIVLLVTDGDDYSTIKESGLVDLGLPSGTLWKDKDEEGGFYTYDQAMNKFGSQMPTKEQFEELLYKCQWSWTGNGYKVVGLNGNYIILFASGWRECDGSVDDNEGSYARYWTSTPAGLEYAWYLYYSYQGGLSQDVNTMTRCMGNSIRLVQTKN